MSFRPVPVQPDHPCFACGHANPIGLKMEFETDGQRLRAQLAVPERMCGWRGVAHGGIVSTVLDEVMGNAAVVLLERLVLTRAMRVSYKKPVRIGVPITAEAWVRERIDDRRATMGASIIDAEGLCAEASGDFALFTVQAATKLGLDGNLVRDFETFMELTRET